MGFDPSAPQNGSKKQGGPTDSFRTFLESVGVINTTSLIEVPHTYDQRFHRARLKTFPPQWHSISLLYKIHVEK